MVVAALSAALTKEAFSLAIIGVAALRTVMSGRTIKPPAAAWLVLVAGLAELAIAIAVGASAGQFSAGGRYVAVPRPIEFIGSLAHNTVVLAFVGMLWVAPLMLFRPIRTCRWLLSVPVLVLVVPQLLLYSEQGAFEGKYEAAGGIGIAGASMTCLVWLQHIGRETRYRSGLGLWIAGLLAFGFSTWTYARYFTEDSVQLRSMVQAVAASTQPTQIVAIAADPGRQYEPILSLVDHIAHQGRGDAQIKLLPLPPAQPYSAIEASLAQDLPARRMAQLTSTDCRNLGAIIVLGDETAARAELPCLDQAFEFQRREFSADVLLWGGDAVSLRPRLPGTAHVTYLVFLR
jgi:hypothetical protein